MYQIIIIILNLNVIYDLLEVKARASHILSKYFFPNLHGEKYKYIEN